VFAVFAYIVYFTILWMLFVSDEPATILHNRRNLVHQAKTKPNQAPRLAVANSQLLPQMALTLYRRVAKDLNQLGLGNYESFPKVAYVALLFKWRELVQALQ